MEKISEKKRKDLCSFFGDFVSVRSFDAFDEVEERRQF